MRARRCERGRAATRKLVLCVAILGLLPGAPSAASCVQSLSTTGSDGDLIIVTGIATSDINTAIGYWMICGSYGVGFPSFTSNSSASGAAESIQVQYHPDQVGSHCGNYDQNSHTISLYGKSLTSQGSQYNCNYTDTLAHELGHVLGLGDSSCSKYMMSQAQTYYSNGEIYAYPRSVQSGECSEADKDWLTLAELPDPDKPPPGPCTK